MPALEIPVEFLIESSPDLLGSLELSSLNDAANARKQIIQLIDFVIEKEAMALRVRWMREHREELCRMTGNSWQSKFTFENSLT